VLIFLDILLIHKISTTGSIRDYEPVSDMATKTKLNRIELEVEKYRAAGNWAKLLDLSKQITSKGSDQGIERLIRFITD